MGGWGLDESPDFGNGGSSLKESFYPEKIGQSDPISTKKEKQIDCFREKVTTIRKGSKNLLEFVDNLSVVPTQTPVNSSKEELAPVGKVELPRPPSFDSISLDFIDHLESDVSDFEESIRKPGKRTCFALGTENDAITSDDSAKYQDVKSTVETEKKTSSKELNTKSLDKLIPDDEVPHDVSVDMFEDQFDIDFDLGDFGQESPPKDDTVASTKSPMLSGKKVPGSHKIKSDINFSDDGSFINEKLENSLAHVTLTQRVENQALFADFPKIQSSGTVPVAEVKPQRLSFGNFKSDCNDNINVEVASHLKQTDCEKTASYSEQKEEINSHKRKRAVDHNETNMSKRKKNANISVSSPNQFSKVTPMSKQNSDQSDDSPLLMRRPRSKKLPFSPRIEQSQQGSTSEEENGDFVNFEDSRFLHKRAMSKLMRSKHSTPKGDYFGKGNFLETENKDFESNLRNAAKLKNPTRAKVFHRRMRDFIDDEAEVSDDGVKVSSDEDEMFNQKDLEELKDFVNDATILTQHVADGSGIDEQAMYLQRKPDFLGEAGCFEGHGGKFKLAYGVGEEIDVFSQEVPADISGYEEDSFVCDDVENKTDDVSALGEVTLLDNVPNTSGRKQRLTRGQAKQNRLRKMEYDASPVLPAVAKIKKKESGKGAQIRKRIVCFDDSTESSEPDLRQGSSSNSHKEQTWTCPACTLINQSSSQICELCDCEKPRKSEGKQNAEVEKSWTCKTCTYMNHSTLKLCDMCGELFTDKHQEPDVSEKQPVVSEKSAIRNLPSTSFFKTKTGTDQEKDGTSNNLRQESFDKICNESSSPDMIFATPISTQRENESRKRLDLVTPKTSMTDNRGLLPGSSQISLNSSSNSDEREERLKRCKQKQMEFRARMEKRRSIQNSGPDADVILSATKTSLQFKSPSHTSSDLINSSLVSPIKQKNSDSDKNVILVDSKELSSSQAIITALRCKHNVHVAVASLPHCDYIVGRGTAVERKLVSDLSQVNSRQKLVARFQQLNLNYDRVYLIVEQDRAKKGDLSSGRPARSSYYTSTVCSLTETSVRVLYSDNQEETASILSIISAREKSLNRSIDVAAAEKASDAKYRFLLRLYSTLPKVSFVSALYMCCNFKNFKEASCSSVEKLMQKAHLSTSAAAEVYSFFRRNFDLQMTPSR